MIGGAGFSEHNPSGQATPSAGGLGHHHRRRRRGRLAPITLAPAAVPVLALAVAYVAR